MEQRSANALHETKEKTKQEEGKHSWVTYNSGPSELCMSELEFPFEGDEFTALQGASLRADQHVFVVQLDLGIDADHRDSGLFNELVVD